ncbi:hypothetical protein DXV75_00535 [Alteromonas aestuariivivens]|uniref:YdbS-like PH domain-containing protein n=1 Tax=Alteromonas aestuariivivens TaxID=1938339 RepID=A0A3D8MDR0_9ALTE|nr:PH domain-containing protein [Alteromonas aestuariivivens]RDV28989.1 hypothetical protein DXV75_00535 [Alteromonas aestuariivivens]
MTVSSSSSPTGAEAVSVGPATSVIAQWQRLSPLAILYFTASNIRKLVSFAVFMIPAVAVGLNITRIAEAQWFWPVALCIALAMAGSGIANHLFFHFRISARHLDIREGVLQRRHINLPFWRIQSVKIEQPVYFRLTRFVVVILDTAGSSNEEAKLVAVPRDYAETLKQQILFERQQHLKGQAGETVTIDHGNGAPEICETVLNTRSIKDLVIHGVTNNRVWILLGALAPFFDEISDFLYFWLDSLGIDLEALINQGVQSWWQLWLYGMSLLLLVMTFVALLSVIGSLLTYYGYTLSKQHDRYIRRSGLLSTEEVSLKLSRLQMVAARQDWLDRLLQRANLFFEQNLTGTDPNQELMAANKLVVPSVTNSEVRQLVGDALPGNRMYDADYLPVNKRFILHQYLVWLMPLSAGMICTSIWIGLWQGLALSVAVALIASLLVQFRYRRWGVAWDNRYVYVRSGIVGIDRRCFEFFKVQQVKIHQSYWMKVRKLATVKLVLASGSVTIPYLPAGIACELADLTLYHVEKSRRSWM